MTKLMFTSDVVYVAGGNTTAMLALWRRFGFEEILHEAWEEGLLLSAHTAGAVCWFEAFVSDSFGGALQFDDGLGWLKGSCCTHYDSQPHRSPACHVAVADGFPAGYEMDDGTGLYFEDSNMIEAVTSGPEAVVRRIELGSKGEVTESSLEMRPILKSEVG